jgi:hypothetical protein
MQKLKLGTITDDKPVKLTVELPASVHRDLAAYTDALARETGQSISDPGKTGRADADPLHGNRSRFCKGTPEGAVCTGQEIAFTQQLRKFACAGLSLSLLQRAE